MNQKHQIIAGYLILASATVFIGGIINIVFMEYLAPSSSPVQTVDFGTIALKAAPGNTMTAYLRVEGVEEDIAVHVSLPQTSLEPTDMVLILPEVESGKALRDARVNPVTDQGLVHATYAWDGLVEQEQVLQAIRASVESFLSGEQQEKNGLSISELVSLTLGEVVLTVQAHEDLDYALLEYREGKK
jgi:hypothetical protein